MTAKRRDAAGGPLDLADEGVANGTLEVDVVSPTRSTDRVAEEWPVAIYVNGAKLVTVLCTPSGLQELALGFVAYLSLAKSLDDIRSVAEDRAGKRVLLEMDVDDDQIRRAMQLIVTSTCGANLYGSQLPVLVNDALESGFRVRASHILECMRSLRSMAPVFKLTGCTHQAAFSDGQAICIFFEDIGRHNAVDKIVGRALMEGRDLSQGVLVTTGRISSEMVLKAVRQRVPVLASRSAPTAHAVRLSAKHGLTLVGFARGSRLNVYTFPDRVEMDG